MIKGNKLSSDIKKETLALSHAVFRDRLISKAETRGCLVLLPRNETGTTKTCGICFRENNKIGASEVFECHQCALKAGRDVNAPRNIFIRQITITE